MRIDEFLLARIAEDEAVALGVQADTDRPWEAWRASDEAGYYAVATTRDRALAECEAKRAIVAIHKFIDYGPTSVGEVCERCVSPDDWVATPFADEHYPCSTIRHLAAVYAGHPDYRDEWRP